jgi:hypothetical protein
LISSSRAVELGFGNKSGAFVIRLSLTRIVDLVAAGVAAANVVSVGVINLAALADEGPAAETKLRGIYTNN